MFLYGMRHVQVCGFVHNEGPRTLADAVRSAQRHLAVQNPGNLEGATAAPVMGIAEDEGGYEAPSN